MKTLVALALLIVACVAAKPALSRGTTGNDIEELQRADQAARQQLGQIKLKIDARKAGKMKTAAATATAEPRPAVIKLAARLCNTNSECKRLGDGYECSRGGVCYDKYPDRTESGRESARQARQCELEWYNIVRTNITGCGREY